MSHQPKLKNVMTPFPYSVVAEAPIEAAVEFMRRHKIRHLPVTAKGALTSLVSDRDIKLVLGPDFASPNSGELKVRDAMLRHMATERIGSAVVTRRGKLAGVFTANDACRAFAGYLEDVEAIDGDDAA